MVLWRGEVLSFVFSPPCTEYCPFHKNVKCTSMNSHNTGMWNHQPAENRSIRTSPRRILVCFTPVWSPAYPVRFVLSTLKNTLWHLACCLHPCLPVDACSCRNRPLFIFSPFHLSSWFVFVCSVLAVNIPVHTSWCIHARGHQNIYILGWNCWVIGYIQLKFARNCG